jgi:hypothetical protein
MLFTSVVPNCETRFAMQLGFRIVVQNAWNLVRFYLNTLIRFMLAAGDYGKDKVIELIELVILKFLTIAENSLFKFLSNNTFYSGLNASSTVLISVSCIEIKFYLSILFSSLS